MRHVFTHAVRWMSKRARVHEAKAATAKATAAKGATGAADAAAAESAASAAAPAEILLWRCNKQLQARLMVMAAAAQFLLGVAYLDSLWLVKSKEAETEMLQELKDGFADAQRKSPLHFLTTTDKVLGVVIAATPFVLMVASRFSTGRWVHELKLVSKGQVAVQTYNFLGQRVTRVMPLANVQRYGGDDNRVLISGKTFMLPKGGEMFNAAIFERSFRRKT